MYFLRSASLFVFLVFFSYLFPAMAVDIVVLGTLAGGTYTYAQGISGDGKVVVGYGDSSEGTRAFRYSASDGMVNLGVINGSNYSAATATSFNGNVVVGDFDTSINSLKFSHAFRWVNGVGMQDIGTLGGNFSYAHGVSADGNVVVGYSGISTNYHAYRWVDGIGMQDLGTLGGNNSRASAVSADGSIVVGYNESTIGYSRAFRWVDGIGMQDIGTLGGNNSRAWAVSGDGSIVVGYSDLTSGYSHAYRWVDGIGMQDINPFNSNYSSATGISADGKVIVGNYDSGSFLWDETNNISVSVWNRLQAQGANLTGWQSNGTDLYVSLLGGNINNLTMTGQGMYNGNWTSFLITNFNATVAPEPSTLILTGIASLAIGAYSILKRKNINSSLENLTVYASNVNEVFGNATIANRTSLGNGCIL